MSTTKFLAVGDRVRNTLWPAQDAFVTVTGLTAAGGFKYRHEVPHSLGPRYGSIHEGEVYPAGLDSWERVVGHPAASTPSSKHFVTTQLRRHADALEEAAKDARKMADLTANMPDPIGPFVIEIARALRPHGLAVVNREAVRTAIDALEAFEPGETDHPEDARAALDSLKTTLTT